MLKSFAHEISVVAIVLFSVSLKLPVTKGKILP